MKIAIIGGGITGLGAALALSEAGVPFTLFEKESRLGGHSNTQIVSLPEGQVPVDTGFIVYNTLTYPLLTKLFEHLSVETEPSNMGFSISVDSGAFEWAGDDDLNGLFAQKRNLINPFFYGMLFDILRFNAAAKRALKRNTPLTLGEFLRRGRYGKTFRTHYIQPMAAAIWSMPSEAVLDFPAKSFFQFFNNHRLLHFSRPRWRTVSGGSATYVHKIVARLPEESVRLNAPVLAVYRREKGVEIIDVQGDKRFFSHVLFACHTDDISDILADPLQEEKHHLSQFRYHENTAYLHSDSSLMPRRREAWAAWNVLQTHKPELLNKGVSLTYWMNRLQNLETVQPLFVSLNPPYAPHPDVTYYQTTYAHPQYSRQAFEAQAALRALSGENHTLYAGAWCGYGFHEDGLRSALEALALIGVSPVWAA